MLCAISKECNFYSESLTNNTVKNIRDVEAFCTNGYTKCSRYIVSMMIGSEFVPLDMRPKHINRAKEMIGGAEVF